MSFIKYKKSAISLMKAWNFINDLQAYSLADKWFEKLPQEEKMDWTEIDCLFHKRWLKEEILSIKETATIENEPRT